MRTSIRVCTIVTSVFIALPLYSCGTQQIGDSNLQHIDNSKQKQFILRGKLELPSAKGFSVKNQSVSLFEGATVVLKYPPDHPDKANKIIATTIMNNYNFEIPLGPEFNIPVDDVMIVETSKRILGKTNKIITLQTYVKRLNDTIGFPYRNRTPDDPSPYIMPKYYNYDGYNWGSIRGERRPFDIIGTEQHVIGDLSFVSIDHITTTISVIANLRGINSASIGSFISNTSSDMFQLPEIQKDYSQVAKLVTQVLQNQEIQCQ